MRRPAHRRPHRAPAQAVRISGHFGQGTAAKAQTKSNLTTGYAYSSPTNQRAYNSRLPRQVPWTAKIIFSIAGSSRKPAPRGRGERSPRSVHRSIRPIGIAAVPRKLRLREEIAFDGLDQEVRARVRQMNIIDGDHVARRGADTRQAPLLPSLLVAENVPC